MAYQDGLEIVLVTRGEERKVEVAEMKTVPGAFKAGQDKKGNHQRDNRCRRTGSEAARN